METLKLFVLFVSFASSATQSPHFDRNASILQRDDPFTIFCNGGDGDVEMRTIGTRGVKTPVKFDNRVNIIPHTGSTIILEIADPKIDETGIYYCSNAITTLTIFEGPISFGGEDVSCQIYFYSNAPGITNILLEGKFFNKEGKEILSDEYYITGGNLLVKCNAVCVKKKILEKHPEIFFQLFNKYDLRTHSKQFRVFNNASTLLLAHSTQMKLFMLTIPFLNMIVMTSLVNGL